MPSGQKRFDARYRSARQLLGLGWLPELLFPNSHPRRGEPKPSGWSRRARIAIDEQKIIDAQRREGSPGTLQPQVTLQP
jgi:hypothetical protein